MREERISHLSRNFVLHSNALLRTESFNLLRPKHKNSLYVCPSVCLFVRRLVCVCCCCRRRCAVLCSLVGATKKEGTRVGRPYFKAQPKRRQQQQWLRQRRKAYVIYKAQHTQHNTSLTYFSHLSRCVSLRLKSHAHVAAAAAVSRFFPCCSLLPMPRLRCRIASVLEPPLLLRSWPCSRTRGPGIPYACWKDVTFGHVAHCSESVAERRGVSGSQSGPGANTTTRDLL